MSSGNSASVPAPADALLDEGESAFGEGRLDEAERCFRAVLALDARSVRALNDLGVLHFQRGEADAAAARFSEALSIDPLDRATLANAAELLLAAGQPATAVPLLDRYLRAHPDDDGLRALRDRCAAAVGPRVTAGDGPARAHGRRPRFLVGTHNIAAYVGNLTEGLRALGYEADSVLLQASRFYGSYIPDYTHADVMQGTRIVRDASGELQCSLSRETADFLLNYDCFIFVAAHSFLPGNLDFPMLQQAGKSIVSWLCGSEARHWSAAAPMWEALGSRLPGMVRDTTVPSRAERMGDVVSHGRYHNTLANKLHNTRMAERFSRVIYSVPETNSLGVRPYMSIGAPIDLSRFTYRVPGREVPVVLHAPSSRGFKQSELILATLERLRGEGVAFELRLLENAPHEEVVAALADADVVVDEMSLYPAVLSHEAMSSGCAVLTGNVPASLPLPREKPAMHIEPANLYTQLRRVLTDRALRIELAERGRAYVETYAARDRVAASVVEDLEAADTGRHDIYPVYFTRDFTIPDGDRVPAYLQSLTLDVLRRHGAPPDVDLDRLANAGLVPAGVSLADVPRWTAATRDLAPWIRCRADIWEAPAALAPSGLP
jgi:tetratricopeptide (TPR) repeat protein